MKKDIRPVKLWFILPVVLFVIGIACAVFFGGMAFALSTGPKAYITLPGTTEVTVQEAGVNEIYYEYTMSYQLDEDVIFSFENSDTGYVAESYTPNKSSTYTVGGTNGQLVAQVNLPQPGRYLVTGNYAGAKSELRFLVGKNVVLLPILFLNAAILSVIFGVGGAIASLAIIIAMRESSKNRLAAMTKVTTNDLKQQI